MRATLLVLVGCAAATPRPVLRNAPRAALAFDVAFARTTIAFHERGVRRDGAPPERLDETPCRATGEPWRDAEDAVLDAFAGERAVAGALRRWRDEGPLVVRRAPFADWLDAHQAISPTRRRGSPIVDVRVRVTRTSGYLVLWGPPGVQVYCFAIARDGGRVTLTPRIVSEVDF